jgi:quercetin dioxygenase-like cupin family protein
MGVTLTAASLFATLAAAGLLGAALVQEKAQQEKKEASFVSADQAKFKEVIPGVSKAMLSGDPDKGAYQAFTKFAPGVTNALHTHANDVTIVVLKGAYLYKPEVGEERRVGAGCYLRVPGGIPHVSGGDPAEGALFFEESPGKFDLTFVEKK